MLVACVVSRLSLAALLLKDLQLLHMKGRISEMHRGIRASMEVLDVIEQYPKSLSVVM